MVPLFLTRYFFPLAWIGTPCFTTTKMSSGVRRDPTTFHFTLLQTWARLTKFYFGPLLFHFLQFQGSQQTLDATPGVPPYPWCPVTSKMMHMSDPTCYLFVAWIYVLRYVPWAGNSVMLKQGGIYIVFLSPILLPPSPKCAKSIKIEHTAKLSIRFQRSSHFSVAQNNKIQKKLNPYICSTYKSISASSDSFCLITSHVFGD